VLNSLREVVSSTLASSSASGFRWMSAALHAIRASASYAFNFCTCGYFSNRNINIQENSKNSRIVYSPNPPPVESPSPIISNPNPQKVQPIPELIKQKTYQYKKPDDPIFLSLVNLQKGSSIKIGKVHYEVNDIQKIYSEFYDSNEYSFHRSLTKENFFYINLKFASSSYAIQLSKKNI
jgi:hypothetical protein